MMTDVDLQNMATHVQYEIDEFRCSFQDWSGVSNNPHQWNRTLESVLLHFRVLRAFFFAEGTSSRSNLHACHYIAGWAAKRDSVFDTTKKAIDKKLAHLTLKGLTSDKKWSELDQMSKAIEDLTTQFKKSLSPTQQGWFPALESPSVKPALEAASNSAVSGPGYS